jgi:Zinc knuckle
VGHPRCLLSDRQKGYLNAQGEVPMVPMQPRLDIMATITCQNCNNTGHMSGDCTQPPTCNGCGKRGHTHAQCRGKKTAARDPKCDTCLSVHRPAKSECRMIKGCWTCGSLLHRFRQCWAGKAAAKAWMEEKRRVKRQREQKNKEAHKNVGGRTPNWPRGSRSKDRGKSRSSGQ